MPDIKNIIILIILISLIIGGSVYFLNLKNKETLINEPTKEQNLEEILKDLTSPIIEGGLEISENIIKSLTAPNGEEASEETIQSLTVPPQ